MNKFKKLRLYEKYQPQIDEIMDCFDFQKVQKTMKLLNWRWATSDSETGVPEEYEIRETARGLLNDVVFHDCTITSCGGFRAERSGGRLRLAFEIADWDLNMF